MISTHTHAALDGLSAAALALGPRLLGWPRRLREPLAAAGAGVAAYSLATRYEEDGAGALSMREHLALDALQGAGFLAAAALLDREPPEARRALAGYGAFSLVAALLTEGGPGDALQGPPQVPLSRAALARAGRRDGLREVAPDVAWRRLAMVNVAFLGPPGAGDRGWVLVDCGLKGMSRFIEAAAAARFGAGARPAAIILTHGHFDHVGALPELAERWDAPVFAHPLEHPYLDGSAAYPPGDPGVGGGAMAALAPLYPTRPIDLGPHLRTLPGDGTVPGAPGWRWQHTPGHSPGHVSLWRPADRLLLSGDAVITTRQESAYAVAAQRPELHGPPAYFTIAWDEARESARRLAALEPETLVSGHGPALAGPAMRAALDRLAARFDALAVPQGRPCARRSARPGGGAYR